MIKSRYNEKSVVQRSYLLFENSCKSQQTLRNYKYHLERFLRFTKIKDYDSLANLDTEIIQTLLEDYIFSLKSEGLSGMSIRCYLTAIESFFDCNRKFYYKKALHKLFPEIEKAGNEKSYTTEDAQKMLSSTTSKRNKALIHFLASTGARPASIADPVLQFKHITPMSFGCKAILIYENSKEEYWVFLTPEASLALDDYRDERKRNGELVNLESMVFRSHNHAKNKKVRIEPLSIKGLQFVINGILKKSGIERIKRGNRYDKAICYGFRKRFNTILKLDNNVNSNIAEKLMAHKRGLDGRYLTPTREQCFAEFVKAIPELTIDESQRLRIRLKESKSDKDSRISKLESDLKNVYRLLNQISAH